MQLLLFYCLQVKQRIKCTNLLIRSHKKFGQNIVQQFSLYFNFFYIKIITGAAKYLQCKALPFLSGLSYTFMKIYLCN